MSLDHETPRLINANDVIKLKVHDFFVSSNLLPS
jgi:hypothetical protein